MRIGLIGCGHHGRNAVAPAITAASNGSALIAVADIDPENLAQAPDVAKYTNYVDMLNRETFDTVYVATLADTHEQIVSTAIKSGRHVICEKPLAETSDACRRLVDLAKQANRHLVLTFETRYYQYVRKIREWIGAGHLGPIEACHIQHFWDGHKASGPHAERRKRLMDKAGGLDCGIHKIDLARHLCGGDWQWVQALGAWLDDDTRFPPHISILGKLTTKVNVTINASMAYASRIQQYRPESNMLHLVGTTGVVALNEKTLTLYSDQLHEELTVDHPSHTHAITLLIDDLANAVDNGKEPPLHLPTGYDGLQAQIATEWANAKALENKEIN